MPSNDQEVDHGRDDDDVHVTPSEKVVWTRNFELCKEFYEKTGHLSFPKTEPKYAHLRRWLTYQRHYSTTLRKDQLAKLESIKYNSLPPHHDRDGKGWEKCFAMLKKLHDITGSIRVGGGENSSLSNWLPRQRRLMRNNELDPKLRERLQELGVKPGKGRTIQTSKRYDEKWQ
jgi:hypothetical protein